jgi:regulatory protein
MRLSYDDLPRVEVLKKAREKAMRLLAYRDRSVYELKSRLITDHFPEDIAEEITLWLIDAGLLDDKKFCKSYVDARTAVKPMGKARLTRELRNKGISVEVIEEAVRDIDNDSEYDIAKTLIERKLLKISDKDNLVKKLESFLSRRGFDWEVINKVIAENFESE